MPFKSALRNPKRLADGIDEQHPKKKLLASIIFRSGRSLINPAKAD